MEPYPQSNEKLKIKSSPRIRIRLQWLPLTITPQTPNTKLSNSNHLCLGSLLSLRTNFKKWKRKTQMILKGNCPGSQGFLEFLLPIGLSLLSLCNKKIMHLIPEWNLRAPKALIELCQRLTLNQSGMRPTNQLIFSIIKEQKQQSQVTMKIK